MSEMLPADDDTQSVMESAGFMLRDALEPGVYVRRAETIQKDTINWQPEPTELLREVSEHLQRFREEVRATGRIDAQ